MISACDRPEHAGLRRQVARFVEREVEPNAAARDEAGFVPREVLRRMGALGWLGLTVPAADGGAGADRVTNVVFREALARCTSGGSGYMREAAIGRLVRDARILAIGGGATEVMLEELAKRLGEAD
jgi:alkylation response protein AidB-like acyl-CoA dehydrogenase